jgi:hemoglobin
MTDTLDRPTLYDALGAEPGVAAIVRELYDRLLADPTTKGYFDGVDMEGKQIPGFTAWLIGGLGGPNTYQGPSLRTTHAGMGITDAALDTTAIHLLAILDERGVDSWALDEITTVLSSLRPEIVTA